MDTKAVSSYENGSFVAETSLASIPETKIEEAKVAVPDKKNDIPSDTTHFTINLCKDYKISINKPMINLKLALFTYYGAGSFMPSFLTVLYKQRGVTLAELSTFTIIAPLFQFIGSTVSGIVADKIGRSKPVLFANLFLVTMTVLAILLTPKIERTNCNPTAIDVFCNYQETGRLMSNASCEQEGLLQLKTCEANCPNNTFIRCIDHVTACDVFQKDGLKNVSLAVYVEKFYTNKTGDRCPYVVNGFEYQNRNISWCDVTDLMNCSLSCETNSTTSACEEGGLNTLLLVYAALFFLFLTTYSNTYRCMDVTTMFLCKEHNSDFGHERFFAIIGNVIISPIAGIIAEATSPIPGGKNYEGGLYLFVAMTTVLFVIIYKLPVRVVPPGEKMFKKSLKLIKNIDVVMFFIVIFILGTTWNFSKYFLFWYLEELQAPGLLIGMVTSVSALYGLPFLLTAKWWIKKIGANGMIISAFFAYFVYMMGYSFLQNPWYSLALEATGVVQYYLLWVAVIEHSHDIAPEGLTSTIITISGAIHFSIGKSSSGIIARTIMDTFGGRFAFRFYACICLAVAILYSIYVYFRRRHSSTKHTLNPSPQKTKSLPIENGNGEKKF